MKSDKLYLEDIVASINKIFSYVQNYTEDSFLEHIDAVNEAVLLNLITIGEACSKVSMTTRNIAPKVPWKKIINLRNVAVHQYYDVDYQQIWRIVQEDLKPLKELIEPLLESANRL